MGFPLQRQADALDAGRGEANDYSKSNAGTRRQFHHLLRPVVVAALRYCYLESVGMLETGVRECRTECLAVTTSVAKRDAEGPSSMARDAWGSLAEAEDRDQQTDDVVVSM